MSAYETTRHYRRGKRVMKEDKMKKILTKVLKWAGILCLLAVLLLFSINFYVRQSTKKQILDEAAAAALDDVDCILVLGAGIWGDRPSPMLEDRLQTAISLYDRQAAPKLLMSGDHGREEYDEVNTMKRYAMTEGVPSEDIFMDHAGFSSYESMYRAKEIFQAKKIIIVTQEYHLYRSLYIARRLGLEAYGVSADPRQYAGAAYRECREILARNKDFVKCIFKPRPTYLGDTIPVNGNGNMTNDQ